MKEEEQPTTVQPPPHPLTAMLRRQAGTCHGTGATTFDSNSEGTGKDD